MPIHNNNQAVAKAAWSIDQWLGYLSEIHPVNIEMGLDRVSEVYRRLELNFRDKTVITVAGTNGKGTTCAMIEQALLMLNKTVAVFSSPHLIDYRERVRVQGEMLSNKLHCQAFNKIEEARQEVSLTYFEFGTLQALQLITEADSEFVILEVGLGGRLDAVNIVEPNIAVITSIDLDHQEWLGNTRDAIAIEKAGIFRANIPAIIGEPEPPKSLVEAAKCYGVKAGWQGIDFNYSVNDCEFSWTNQTFHLANLPLPLIPAQNASTALQVLSILAVPLSSEFIASLFKRTYLQGRRQLIQQNPTVLLDVAHNPHATRLLAQEIKQQNYKKVIAVVGMLADKDIQQSLLPLLEVIDDWYCATLHVPRGAKSAQLVSVLREAPIVLEFSSIEKAYSAALSKAEQDDLILVFGSFYTVAEVISLLKEY